MSSNPFKGITGSTQLRRSTQRKPIAVRRAEETAKRRERMAQIDAESPALASRSDLR